MKIRALKDKFLLKSLNPRSNLIDRGLLTLLDGYSPFNVVVASSDFCASEDSEKHRIAIGVWWFDSECVKHSNYLFAVEIVRVVCDSVQKSVYGVVDVATLVCAITNLMNCV